MLLYHRIPIQQICCHMLSESLISLIRQRTYWKQERKERGNVLVNVHLNSLNSYSKHYYFVCVCINLWFQIE